MSITMIIVYLIMILSNIIINAQFYFGSRKHPIYKWGLIYWTAAFVHSILHAETFPEYIRIFGISIVAICNYSVLKICSNMLNIKPDDKFYRKVSLSWFLISLPLIPLFKFEHYIWSFILMCIFPYMHYTAKNIKQIWKTTNKLEKVMVLTYFLNVLHLINYPLMMGSRELLFIGFNIAFGFASILSLFIYLTADSIYIKEIEAKLKEEIEKTSKLYKSVIASEIILSLSHEINNAIQSLQFNQEVLKLKAKKTQDIHLEKISKNMKISVSKINDILIPFYKGIDDLSPVDLNEIIEDTKSFIDPFLKMNKIELNFENKTSSKLVSTSKGVFSQLLVHIIKALSKQNGSILIKIDDNQIEFLADNTNNLGFDIVEAIADQLKLTIKREHGKVFVNLPTSLSKVA